MKRPPTALGLAMVPSLLFAVLLWRNSSPLVGIHDVKSMPGCLAVLVVGGSVGLVGATLDHRYHRSGAHPVVGAPEHRTHIIALASALPLFAVMAAATGSRAPGPWLVPAVVLTLHVAAWVAYDAFVYHRRRRSSGREQLFHAMTTLGNGTALLAWMHAIWGTR